MVVKSIVHDVTYAQSMDADKNGDVAVVTDAGSLYLLNGGRIVNMQLPGSGNEYTSCRYIDDMLYVSTATDEIHIYSTQDGKLSFVKKLVCDGIKNIKALYYNDDNTLFVCADNGVAYFDAYGNYEMINTGNVES